jgi:branched-subunit amino acid ABC-type transport system permease component
MNRQQTVALCLAAANLALVLAFPPYDYLSLAHGYVPTFGGFHFVAAAPANSLLNHTFLALEEIVILINAGIAWLLLRSEASDADRRISRGQRSVLWLIGINLVLILLFPPFENYYAITKAVLPSFDGFYFLFGNNSQRQIVTTILYMEVALVLINGGLLWLLLADRGREKISAREMRELVENLRKEQRF